MAYTIASMLSGYSNQINEYSVYSIVECGIELYRHSQLAYVALHVCAVFVHVKPLYLMSGEYQPNVTGPRNRHLCSLHSTGFKQPSSILLLLKGRQLHLKVLYLAL